MMSMLVAEEASFGYGHRLVCDRVSIEVPHGAFTVIVGANASGKSTLLKGLARLLAPTTGAVLLDGKRLHELPTKQVARSIGLLPQGPIAPDGIRVADLVARGRYPHQRLLAPWSGEDQRAVDAALQATGIEHLATRLVDELSGGQRQRVWLAVALAQRTSILLLDEPTTYLDLTHQIELLELCRRLNEEEGTTLVAVLHDLNQAARYAQHVIAMRDGTVVATGTPREVFTEELVHTVFGLSARIMDDPESGSPMVIPRWSAGSAG